MCRSLRGCGVHMSARAACPFTLIYPPVSVPPRQRRCGWWFIVRIPDRPSSPFPKAVSYSAAGSRPRNTPRSERLTPPPLAPKKTPAKRNKTNKNTRRENADSKPLPRNMTATAVKRWKLARKQIQMYMLTRTHTWTRGEGQSHSVGAVCLSVLSSCYEIRGEHQRNLLPGYKTEAAQGKNGNASMSGGRGLPGCNHSC